MYYLPITETGNYQTVTENNYGCFVGISFFLFFILLWLEDPVEYSAERAGWDKSFW